MRESHKLSIDQLAGGGVSWFYLFDKDGRIVMSAHEDDRQKMQEMYAKLDEMKRAERR